MAEKKEKDSFKKEKIANEIKNLKDVLIHYII